MRGPSLFRRYFGTSRMSSRLTDGVFAMEKPPSLSSAQVLRELQEHFIPSNHFAAVLAAERERLSEESSRQRKRRKDSSVRIKLGHGGTLDPLATGILVCGVGSGTKDLPNFLNCQKTYEAVVLFGAATDTYDCSGRIVARAPYRHISRAATEAVIEQKFKGNIKQKPPIFSALRIDGKHAYEYAREGKELPREMAERDMVVDECVITEWYEPGTHQYQWPSEEAPEDERDAMRKVYTQANDVEAASEQTRASQKRSAPDSELQDNIHDRGDTTGEQSQPPSKKMKTSSPGAVDHEEPLDKGSRVAANDALSEVSNDQGAAAAKIRMTVSSGFYVRSFCHDLGLALGSLGLMSSLVRSQQAHFKRDHQEMILTMADVEKGEEHWSPKLDELLSSWPEARSKMLAEKTPSLMEAKSEEELLATAPRSQRKPGKEQIPRNMGTHGSNKRWTPSHHHQQQQQQQAPRRQRQNTSSPE